MRIGGLVADAQQSGDFLGGMAVGYQRQHLHLAGGQWADRRSAARRRDFHAGPEVAKESAVFVELRRPRVANPAVLPIGALQAGLHAERPWRVNPPPVGIQAALPVVRVYTLDPAIAHLLRHRPASEFEPGPIEERAQPVAAGRPKHERGLVDQEAEAVVFRSGVVWGRIARLHVLNEMLMPFRRCVNNGSTIP